MAGNLRVMYMCSPKTTQLKTMTNDIMACMSPELSECMRSQAAPQIYGADVNYHQMSTVRQTI